MPTERMTAAEYRALPKARGNKYHARGEYYKAVWFPSQLELKFYQLCELRQQVRDISNLEIHPKFWLDAMDCWYVADVGFRECSKTVIVDVKSKPTMTALWQAKWKAAKKQYPQYEWRVVTRKDIG